MQWTLFLVKFIKIDPTSNFLWPFSWSYFLPLRPCPSFRICFHPPGRFSKVLPSIWKILHSALFWKKSCPIFRTCISSLMEDSPHCCTMCFGRNLKEKVLKAIIISKNNNSLKESATEIHLCEGDRGFFFTSTSIRIHFWAPSSSSSIDFARASFSFFSTSFGFPRTPLFT